MTVYHLNRKGREVSGLWLNADISTVINFKDNFDKVAEVDCPDELETAFRLTNSIDFNWWENENVAKGSEEGYRSTSVGDVVRLSDRTYHIVDGYGFVKVNPNDPARMRISSLHKQ